MTVSLAHRAETLRLARVLGVEPEALDFLADAPVEALAELRGAVLDRLLERNRDEFGRAVALAGYIPRALAASLALWLAHLVVAGAGWWVVNQALPAPDPASRAVAAHAASSGTEVYGDAERVSTFLKEHAPFAAHVPVADREGVRLIGARVTELAAGTPAIVYLYDVGGRRITVAQYRAPEGGGPTGVHLDRQDGLTVATFPDGGLIHTLVGDVPEGDVSKIIPASWGNQGPASPPERSLLVQ